MSCFLFHKFQKKSRFDDKKINRRKIGKIKKKILSRKYRMNLQNIDKNIFQLSLTTLKKSDTVFIFYSSKTTDDCLHYVENVNYNINVVEIKFADDKDLFNIPLNVPNTTLLKMELLEFEFIKAIDSENFDIAKKFIKEKAIHDKLFLKDELWNFNLKYDQ